MNIQKRILLLLGAVLFAQSISARSAAPVFGQPLWQFQFPEKSPSNQDDPSEAPEPRLIGAVDVGYEDDLVADQQLQQLLLLSSGLSPAQLLQRYQPRHQGQDGNARHFYPGKNGNGGGGSTTILILGQGLPNITTTTTTTNNNNLTSATPATTTTGGTRLGEYIRSPIAYPGGLPMQYFRTRQDEASPLPYAGLYGWNEAALYGAALDGRLGGGLDGGLAGGFSGLPAGFGGSAFAGGVPLVPVTIGNEVRYVPLNLRMFRQLASMPLPMPIRESDEERPNDEDLAATIADDSEPEQPIETLTNGAAEGTPQVTRLGQRLRQRPMMRRNPLQSFAQNIRRVQYL
ncbi:uncharacterized protein LOC111076447 [Drosophila obscura]|uniref:uncharacterized protein LOC111076447 n=1 Tax=Drosophila obscura TaxID=7282 RepID=UPI001BB140B0|nr:uncharacterized protein LOC111076447 [Drosophila obscura]